MDEKVILLQKVWRGWYTRHLLHLAGKGVLRREECHNEDELITGNEKHQVHPMDYFSFVEAGKLYWFDVRSIYQWSLQTINPVNPYTKQELDTETRTRLKECIFQRELRMLPTFHDPLDPAGTKIVEIRWMLICQILKEILFVDVDPLMFTVLSQTDIWRFTTFLRYDLMLHADKHKHLDHSRRNIYLHWICRSWKLQTLGNCTELYILKNLGATILHILKDCKKPYEICFMILSARYRL